MHATKRRSRMVPALAGAILAVLLAAVPRAYAATDTSACFDPAGPAVALAVLDPGHGGGDTGAVNGALDERTLNLDIALRTRDLLLAKGVRVCLTRTAADPNWTNTQRAQYANRVARADGRNVLVLIHLNSVSNPAVDYTKTYWGKKQKDLPFASAMYQALASNLISQRPAGATCAGVQLQPSSVGQFADGALLKSNMPATLAENVFLSNPAEASCLADASTGTLNRRQEIARALAAGITGWFKL